MGGYQEPPDEDANRPKTRAEADAQNVIGRENRARAGLGSSYGESYLYEQQRQQQAREQSIDQRQQAIQQQTQTDYEQQALDAARRRPGFTDPGSLGDRATERFTRATENLNRALSLMGMPTIDTDALTGGILESQRQAALKTPGIRDDLFFGNELSKWKQNFVELGSSFHYVTRDATNVRENPFELQADLALESLKGPPHKRSEWFSPVSGQMSRYLPGGQGLQENMWTAARTGKPQPGSYMDAVQVISSSRGGLVTGKMGSPNRTTIKTPIDSFGGRNLPAPFRSTLSGSPGGTLENLNSRIGGALGIRASALEQGSTQKSDGDFGAAFLKKMQSSFRMVFSNMPGGIGLGMASDTAFAMIRGDKTSLPFADMLNKPPGADSPGILESVFDTYENLNKGLAPYTSDISGMGRLLKGTPDIEDMGIAGDALNFGKGLYIGVALNPIDAALTYATGKVLGIGGGFTRVGVAKAATSGVPGLSITGRALSTPFAGDIGRIGKFGIGALFAGQAGMHIASQPTATGKGEAAGRTAIQFAGFGAGMGSVKMPEPANPYAGRGFFSGKPAIGPIEKIQFKVETAARSLTTSQPGAYREVSKIALPGRVVEPVRKAEPDFTILSKSGKYAPEIKSTLMEQPHSILGSSSVRQQYPPGVAESSGLRIGKDVDAYIASPSKAIISLSGKTGLPIVKTATGIQTKPLVLDAHAIPRNYPGFKPSVEADTAVSESSLLTRMLGDPYRRIATPRGTSEIISPGKGYTGTLTYESAQVQFGRKAAAVSDFIEKPLKLGYRGTKDIYDLITLYKAQRQVAISTGTPKSAFTASDKAMDSFMSRKFDFGTVKGQKPGDASPVVTRTVRGIYDAMFTETGSTRAAMRTGAGIPGKVELTFGSDTPSQGLVSSLFTAAPPSLLIRSTSGSRPSPGGSSPGSQVSSPGSSHFPSSPGSRTFISVPPSLPPGSPRSTPPASPRSIIFTPPSSPPASPTTTTSKPPGSTPRSPPSRIPVTPTIVPPSSPPRRSPPGSPPSSPPSGPPYNPPSRPPSSPPGIFLPDAGGNTNRLFAPRGSYRWSRLNPTTTFEYLSKGMPMPGIPGSRRKKKKGPFG